MTTTPLCFAALTAGASSDWLNPPHYRGACDPHPIRIVARLVYACACMTLMPVSGVVYHVAAATYSAVWLRDNQQAGDHLVGALLDAAAITALALVTLFFIAHISELRRDGFHWNYERTLKNTFGLGITLIIIPLIFTISPDVFRG